MISFRHAGIIAAIFSAHIFAPSFAQENSAKINKRMFQTELGASRLIYNPDSNGAFLSVGNPQDYPILVQGKIYMEDKKKPAPFIVTPPVFRLDARQNTRMRVIFTGEQIAKDRESLQWLCVAGIPPKNNDLWAVDHEGKSPTPKDMRLNMEVMTNSCIKLIVRPLGVKGAVLNAASSMKWQRQGDSLIATNTSGFYINLSSLKVGGVDVKDKEYIAPYSSRSFTLPKGTAGTVKWSVINDEGGESRQFEASL